MTEADRLISFFASRTCKGIRNVGNTCYLSTSLQCLAHCLSFAYPIIANSVNTNSTISYQLRELFKLLWIQQETADPGKLLRALSPRLDDIMPLYQQNDAMEFIMLFIDVITNEIGERAQDKKVDTTLSGSAKLTNIMQVNWVNSHKLAYSYMCDIVYGQTVNQTKCLLCGDIEHRGELFCNLSLAIPSSTNDAPIDLQAMLKEYFRPESVKRDCDRCRLRNVEATNAARIWRSPQVMMIHLKRFDANNNKIRTRVDVPLTMDIDEFVITDAAASYELKAIACHSGATNFGHYFAIVKNPSNQWYIMDDDDPIKPIESPTTVRSDHFYILFYEQVGR